MIPDGSGSGIPSPGRGRDTFLVDVSGLRLSDLMEAEDSPLLHSLRRLAAETDADAIAGFSQGLS